MERNQCRLLLLAAIQCSTRPSTTPSEGITSPHATKITEMEKRCDVASLSYSPTVYPFLPLSLERGKVERQDSRGLTNVLCLHPLLLLFLFVDIPVPAFSTGLYSSRPHYGEVCHINSITEDHVGHPNVYSHTYAQTHKRPHKSGKVTGNLTLFDVTLAHV